jgi:hypothetical protein
MVPAARKAVKTHSTTSLPVFQDVAAGRIELRNDALQPSGLIIKIGQKLEEETAHAGAEQVGYVSEVADERLRPGKTFDVGNEFGGLDGIDELVPPNLS